MAKAKRRVNATNSKAESTGPSAAPPIPAWVIWCRRVAMSLLGGLAIYAAYYPSDSIQVENGDALWFCAMALAVLTLTMSSEPLLRVRPLRLARPSATKAGFLSDLLGPGLVIDLLAWNLAAWMMISAFASCPPGNLRQATNEAWVWVAGAAMITSTRRLLVDRQTRAAMLTLLFAVGFSMAIHALHQEHVSLPQIRAQFLSDPDKVLDAAGVSAPPMSSRRMIFASRLNDGGPTATFALANSLAAVLIIAVIVPTGLLKHWRDDGRTWWQNGFLIALLLAGFAAVMATRSRSAILACLIGVAWLWIAAVFSPSALLQSESDSVSDDSKKRVAARAVLWLLAIAGLILGGVMLLGDDEWMASAPASLEFRLQYWKSTVAMLWEHPIFGAGPGGFQALYLRYRLPIASETVADPHNFFFETLAAGGFIAAGLLVALMLVLRRQAIQNATQTETQTKTRNETKLTDRPLSSDLVGERNSDLDGSVWLFGGACVSLGVIWLLGIASGQMPDASASVFSVPLAMAAGWLIWNIQSHLVSGTRDEHARPEGSDSQPVKEDCQTSEIVGSLIMAMLVHLCLSGGWTVPGVALVIWIAASMLANTGTDDELCGDQNDDQTVVAADRSRLASRVALAGFAVGLALLIAIRFVSIGPAQATEFAQRRAEGALQRGLSSPAEAESKAAMDLDPWGYSASLWRSELILGQIIRADSPSGSAQSARRDSWQVAVDNALERSGENPLVQRAVGEQCVHLYQRFGNREDLIRANELISAAVEGNPTDASLVAQLAVISAELSDFQRFETLADRAWELSLLGGNIVRHLDLKQILVVSPLGRAAGQSAVFAAASGLLAERKQ